MPSRVRAISMPCPKCGTSLHVVEEGITVVEEAQEPVSWAVVRRYCPEGCHLTVEDFLPLTTLGPAD